MGICLDTDASVAQDAATQGNDWNHTRNQTSATAIQMESASNIATIDMPNAGKIKFDPPKVPVIFVLGGPGSGKVTHCDTFMQERRGCTHINMMDLLQQYAMGNDMQDFSQLSSKTVTEVLMLEMKMAPAAKAYLISGYPRSMRDVVEYSEKIQVVNGVILISWRQSVLQKQIDYGAKLGHVVLSLAKMELENFFKNVMPVADYFDQSDMLLAVNGERAPMEVYKDFRTAVLDILSTFENQEAILNGVSGMGRGLHDIPGSIVSVDTAPSQAPNIAEITNANANANDNVNARNVEREQRNVTNDVIAHVAANAASSVTAINNTMHTNGQDIATTTTDATSHVPPIIWIIGGPGSNKSSLCLKFLSQNPSWGHISVGRLLRTITDSAPRANTESYAIKEALSAGEMVSEKIVVNLLESHIRQLGDRAGIIIDGYPRNLEQVNYFQNKYKQNPPIVLLDCSKLQLGRGRVDDTVSSFRRRLELFREFTLPMLKAMDNNNRLQIVDGDTDSPSVQREFEQIIRAHIQTFQQQQQQQQQQANNMKFVANDNATTAALNNQQNHTNYNSQNHNGNYASNRMDNVLNDMEDNMPGAVPTLSQHVSLMNGHLRNNVTSAQNQNRNNFNKAMAVNGNAMPSINNDQQVKDFRHMLQEAEHYPMDSYI